MADRSVEWLEARAEIVAILVDRGVVGTWNDIAGWWEPGPDPEGAPVWVSLYDVLEQGL